MPETAVDEYDGTARRVDKIGLSRLGGIALPTADLCDAEQASEYSFSLKVMFPLTGLEAN